VAQLLGFAVADPGERDRSAPELVEASRAKGLPDMREDGPAGLDRRETPQGRQD
jgi:hypothetical protein